MRYETQIKTAVKRCYFAIEPYIVYTTRQLLPAARRMYYWLFITATLFTNFCALAIVDTWVVLLKGYNRGLSGNWPALASQSEALKLKLSFLLLDNIFYKTLHAHVNIMITNFLFFPMAVLLFIFPLLKPRTSKHPNQIYANKRNSFMV